MIAKNNERWQRLQFSSDIFSTCRTAEFLAREWLWSYRKRLSGWESIFIAKGGRICSYFGVFHNLGHMNGYGFIKCLEDIASFFAS